VAFDLEDALRETLQREGSDLHIKVPARPYVRVQGRLVELEHLPRVTPDDTRALLDRMMPSNHKRKIFESRGSAEFSHYIDEGRFRVSAFHQRGSVAFVFRAIRPAPDFAELGLPAVVGSWIDARRGLVLITGPTGAGKSTTLASMIKLISERKPCHIITLEDPVEYLHPDAQALVSQREIERDAPTYQEALRAALRHDPDVLAIGDIRDEGTAMTALRAGESGHLVIGAVHAATPYEAIKYIEELSRSHESLARQQLAATLVGIVSQRLVPSTIGRPLVNAEVLVNTARVADLIRDRDLSAAVFTNAIAEGGYYGMQTFDADLTAHVRAGHITMAEAMSFASNPSDLRLGMHASEMAKREESEGATSEGAMSEGSMSERETSEGEAFEREKSDSELSEGGMPKVDGAITSTNG